MVLIEHGKNLDCWKNGIGFHTIEDLAATITISIPKQNNNENENKEHQHRHLLLRALFPPSTFVRDVGIMFVLADVVDDLVVVFFPFLLVLVCLLSTL